METFAYLQVASMYEARFEPEGAPERPGIRSSSYRTRAGLMAATLTLSMLGLATNVLALQQGDTGAEVTTLQTELQRVGYFEGPITGFFGPLTDEAVRRYQAANNLVVDGIAGPATVSALQGAPRGGTAIQTTSTTAATSSSGVLRLGDTGPEVTALQTRLQDIGYFSGPVSGVFGPITEDAVKRFQTAAGLTADGIAGSRTQSAMQSFRRGGGGGVPQASANIGGPALDVAGGGASSVSPASTASGDSTTLRLNDSGPQVETLQTNLKVAGFFDSSVTGFYGSLTEDAVRRFQSSSGLVADGVAGPVTQRALQSAANARRSQSSSTPAVSDPPRFSVLELQTRLQQRGFYRGSLDGVMGPQTQAGIAAAQRFYGISGTDITAGRF